MFSLHRRRASVTGANTGLGQAIAVGLAQAGVGVVFARGGRGRIVKIVSLLSFQGAIRVPSFTAPKHGRARLWRLSASEWAARDINVNAIAPGYIETNNTVALRTDPDRGISIPARIPAGRSGRPKDNAGTAVCPCAAAATHVHGAVLNVDGGWLAR